MIFIRPVLAANLREATRTSPRLMLAVSDAPERVSAIADQKLGNQTLPAVLYTVGTRKYIIMFHRTTKLPAAVRTHEADNIWGDQNYDAILSDWKTVASGAGGWLVYSDGKGGMVSQIHYLPDPIGYHRYPIESLHGHNRRVFKQRPRWKWIFHSS
jgi:hypothetical protein